MRSFIIFSLLIVTLLARNRKHLVEVDDKNEINDKKEQNHEDVESVSSNEENSTNEEMMVLLLFCPNTTGTAPGVYGFQVQMAYIGMPSRVWALGPVQSACTTVSGNTWIMKMCQNPSMGSGRMGTSGLDAVSVQLMLLCVKKMVMIPLLSFQCT